MCDVAIPTRSETPFIVRHEIAASALLPPRDDRQLRRVGGATRNPPPSLRGAPMCDAAIPTRSETPFIVRHEIATSPLLPPRDDRQLRRVGGATRNPPVRHCEEHQCAT